MAKRIIENGKYNVIKCSGCGCKFAFDSTDKEANGNVTCPQCGTENTPEKKPEASV
jgi:DNA-directed RNA polymerase subunit RPC12/RpoP